MNSLRKASIVIGLAVLLVATACSTDLDVSNVHFDGSRYSGGPAAQYRIEMDDLEQIGMVTQSSAPVRPEVYSLGTVDQSAAIVLVSDSEDGRLWLMVRDGVLPARSPDQDWLSVYASIDGLCAHMISPPTECT